MKTLGRPRDPSFGEAPVPERSRRHPSKRAALYSQCKALADSPDILAALSSTLRERGIVGNLQNFP